MTEQSESCDVCTKKQLYINYKSYKYNGSKWGTLQTIALFMSLPINAIIMV